MCCRLVCLVVRIIHSSWVVVARCHHNHSISHTIPIISLDHQAGSACRPAQYRRTPYGSGGGGGGRVMRVSDQTQLAKHSVDRELSTEKPHHCHCRHLEQHGPLLPCGKGYRMHGCEEWWRWWGMALLTVLLAALHMYILYSADGGGPLKLQIRKSTTRNECRQMTWNGEWTHTTEIGSEFYSLKWNF